MKRIIIKGHVYDIIGLNNQKVKKWMRQYHENYGDLWCCYGRPSQYKVDAWEEICGRLTNVRMLGAGTFTFSCGGMLVDEERNRHFVIETHCHSYIVIDGWEYI